MIKSEWKSIWNNKLLLLVVIVIAIIPAIYAGLFLASMWDPYGETENLPVAVVNEDKKVSYNDKTLNIGETLAKSLEENKSMAFNVVERDVAEKGLENGTYYMVITIPKDFSSNVTTLMEDNPQKMQLSYKTNPGKNYIAMKMTESAVKEISKNITAEVTRTYAETVFESLDEVAEGFDDAVDGSKQLIDGEKKIKKGNNKINKNLKKLAESTLVFKEGSETLQQGLQTYLDGVDTANAGSKNLVANNRKLKKGVKDVSGATTQLSSGGSSILSGLKTMKGSLEQSLTKENVKQINYAAQSLNTFNSNMQKLNVTVNGDGKSNTGISLDGMTTSLTSVGGNIQASGTNIQSAASSLVGDYASTGTMKGAGYNITKAYTILAQLYDATEDETVKKTLKTAMDSLYNPSNQADADTALGGVLAATTKLSSAGGELTAAGKTLTTVSSSELTGQVKELKDSISQLAQASNQLMPASSKTLKTLLGGLQSVHTGLTQTQAKNNKTGLIEGMSTLKSGLTQLNNGVNKKGGLVSGINSYTAGAAKINNGLATLSSNNAKLSEGANSLTDGAAKISDGAGQLSTGSSTLGEGLDDLMDGTSELKAGLSDGAKQVKENSAEDKNLDMFSEPLETTGETITNVENNGHAMAAYMMTVGLWIGSLAFCLMYPLTKYSGKLKNGVSWWASKAAVIYPLSMLMPIVLLVALHAFLGFNPEQMGLTLLATVVTSLVFMSIMYFFNMLLGKIGSFLMLIFTVLQLAGSAGTYPVEISGTMVPKIHDFVPFTYTVDAFRSTISGGQSIAWDMTVLIILAVVFSALTIFVFQIRANRIKKGKSIVYDLIEKYGLA